MRHAIDSPTDADIGAVAAFRHRGWPRRALACLRALYERERSVAAERRRLLRLAESPHLLEDVGMTREQALNEASRALHDRRPRGGRATGRPS